MHSCIDPPKKGNPGSWPGFQTESSHNNSSLVPQGNFTEKILAFEPEVKPYPPQIVDKEWQGTISSGRKGSGISPDQQELLDRLNPTDQHFGLLLALHDDLRPEHCEPEVACDSWDAEILRRVKKFS